MNQLIERLPKIATETKKQFKMAIDNVKSGPNRRFDPLRLAELLQSKYNEDILEACKMVFYGYINGRDMTVYLSRIISFVPRDDLEIKRLCYILLTEVAANQIPAQAEILLLSISVIFKDIVSLQTATKLFALKTLPQLHIQEIQPLVLSSLKQIIVDKNPLVRRVACTTIIKLKDLTKDIAQEDYQSALEYLLKDTPQTRIAAANAIIKLGDDPGMTFMHQRFYQMLKDLKSLTQFDLTRSVRFLHQYALHYFSHLAGELEQNKGNLSPDALDLQLMLDTLDQFTKLPHPALIVEIASVYMDFPQQSKIKSIVRTLSRFLNISSESKYVVLVMLQKYAQKYPHYVKDHYRQFTIIQIEKLYCKIKKLEILQLLIDDNNFSNILDELLHHTRSNQIPLSAAAIRLIGKTTQKHPKHLKRTITALRDILKNGYPESKNQVIQAFSQIINSQGSPNLLPLLTLCLQFIDEVDHSEYKSRIIRILSREFRHIPTIAVENLRKLIINFTQYHEHVKYEILVLAFHLNNYFKQQNLELSQQVDLFYKYVIELSSFDQSLLIRDLARSFQSGFTLSPFSDLEFLSLPVDQGQFEEQFPPGSISNLVGYELPGLLKPNAQYVVQESTHELRVVKVEKPVETKTPQQTPIQTQQDTQAVQQQQQVQQPAHPKKKKEIDEEVKKHFTNLDKVLNDFFDQ